MLEYIGTYKAVKVYRVSGRREVLKRGLSLEQARSMVNSYPDSTRSMVVYMKQFSAAKYFETVPAIVRYDREWKEIQLFFPDSGSRPGRIEGYAHIGQHFEACLDYYQSTRKVPADKQAKAAALIKEYENLFDCKLHIRQHR